MSVLSPKMCCLWFPAHDFDLTASAIKLDRPFIQFFSRSVFLYRLGIPLFLLSSINVGCSLGWLVIALTVRAVLYPISLGFPPSSRFQQHAKRATSSCGPCEDPVTDGSHVLRHWNALHVLLSAVAWKLGCACVPATGCFVMRVRNELPVHRDMLLQAQHPAHHPSLPVATRTHTSRAPSHTCHCARDTTRESVTTCGDSALCKQSSSSSSAPSSRHHHHHYYLWQLFLTNETCGV